MISHPTDVSSRASETSIAGFFRSVPWFMIDTKAKQVAGGKAEEEQRKREEDQRKREEEQRKAQMDKEDAEEERALAKQERQKKAAAMDPGTEQTLAEDKPEEVLLPAHKKVSAFVGLRAAV